MAIQMEPMQAAQFTRVPNHWIRDPTLSMRGLGLLTYIVSHTSTYNLTVQQVIAQFPDGRHAIRAAMKELEERGYLVRHSKRCGPGRFGEYDYQIVEFPPDNRRSICGGGGSVDGGTAAAEPSTGDSPVRTPPKNTMKEDSPEKSSSPLSPKATASTATTAKSNGRESAADFSNRDQFPNLAHRLLGRLGYDEAWRKYLIHTIVEEHEPYSDGWWVTANSNGSLSEIARDIQQDWVAANRK